MFRVFVIVYRMVPIIVPINYISVFFRIHIFCFKKKHHSFPYASISASIYLLMLPYTGERARRHIKKNPGHIKRLSQYFPSVSQRARGHIKKNPRTYKKKQVFLYFSEEKVCPSPFWHLDGRMYYFSILLFRKRKVTRVRFGTSTTLRGHRQKSPRKYKNQPVEI